MTDSAPAGRGGGENREGANGNGNGAHEIDDLRRRVAELEARTPRPGREHHRWRTTGVALLIVVASFLSMLSVVAVWAHDQVNDTGRFVATMGPLASNPEVQAAITKRVTNVVTDQIDVAAIVNQLSDVAAENGVPPQAGSLINSLTGPIGNGLTSLIGSTVNQVVTSDAFATIWTNAITAAHSAMVKALTGEGGSVVQLNGDEVTIDLAPLIERVKVQLVDAGLGIAAKIPVTHTQFAVYASPALAKVRDLVRWLEIIGDWLPVIAVVIAGIGVYFARSRRRGLMGAAFGFAVAMLVLGIALSVFRGFFLDQLPPDVNRGAAGAVYDAITHFLRESVRVVGVLAVLVLLGAFLIGPSRVAVFTRAAGSTGIGGVRDVADRVGFRAGPVEPFVRRWKHWIGVAILLIASAVFVAVDKPTGMVVFWFAVVILAAFAVREFLAPGPGVETLREIES